MQTIFFDENILNDLPKKTKVVVGIPSYNNYSTIRYVAETVAKGIEKYLKLDAVILNSDGGSSDDTQKSFMSSDTGKIPKLSYEYVGIPGKGSAMFSVMEISKILEAELVIFVDSDLRSIEPWWIDRLSSPILNGKSDYITPYYIRHKYDGTITNQVCYPLTSSLYGKKIRQPIGGDFGVGRKMIDVYCSLMPKLSKSKVAMFGIDIWMTTTALCNSQKEIWQAALGAKIHDVKDPGKHLGPMFDQVVSTIFELAVLNKNTWKKIVHMEKAPIYGEIPEIVLEPLIVDLDNLKEKCSEGLKVNSLSKNLVGNQFDNIMKHKKVSLEQWIDIIYKAVSYFKSGEKKIVEALIPLYFGRVADFVEITKNMDSREAERIVEEQVDEFFKRKGELINILEI
jgi:glycosyltransferase involved in cell wall biosynthesis